MIFKLETNLQALELMRSASVPVGDITAPARRTQHMRQSKINHSILQKRYREDETFLKNTEGGIEMHNEEHSARAGPPKKEANKRVVQGFAFEGKKESLLNKISGQSFNKDEGPNYLGGDH